MLPSAPPFTAVGIPVELTEGYVLGETEGRYVDLVCEKDGLVDAALEKVGVTVGSELSPPERKP